MVGRKEIWLMLLPKHLEEPGSEYEFVVLRCITNWRLFLQVTRTLSGLEHKLIMHVQSMSFQLLLKITSICHPRPGCFPQLRKRCCVNAPKSGFQAFQTWNNSPTGYNRVKVIAQQGIMQRSHQALRTRELCNLCPLPTFLNMLYEYSQQRCTGAEIHFGYIFPGVFPPPLLIPLVYVGLCACSHGR